MRAIIRRPPPVSSTDPTTFGAARAERYLRRFTTLVKQNRTLLAAKNVTQDPVQTSIAKKQEMVAGEMDRLQQKQKDEAES